MLVGTTGLEPVTSCMSSKRSNQLSYAPSSAYVLYQLFFIMASIFTLFILKAPKNSAPFLIINIRRRSRSIRRNRRRSRNRPRRNPPNTRRNRSRLIALVAVVVILAVAVRRSVCRRFLLADRIAVIFLEIAVIVRAFCPSLACKACVPCGFYV